MLDMQQLSTLNPRYASALCVIPCTFMLLAFIPCYFVLGAIAELAGSSIDRPVREVGNFEVWLNVICLLVAIFLFVGLLVGVFLNALVLMFYYNWRESDVLNMLFNFEYPDHWLKSPQERQRAEKRKEKLRKKGKWNFVLKYGVVYFGVPTNLGLVVLPILTSESPVRIDILALFACIWTAIGFFLGLGLWTTNVDEK